jgi:hypothetical protein
MRLFEDEWTPLFNGKNLKGWTPKITKHPLGVNVNDTFRVENGVLRVVYDRYTNFDGQFGHLFYKDKFSHYRLRIEYRFVGEQAAGGPGWALRNSGVMLHCQPPKTMSVGQEFPVSVEVQFLGGLGRGKRTTGNLCTPGTHVVMEGTLVTRHCTESTSETFPGDQWVVAEIEVQGGGVIEHFVNGKSVLRYSEPQLDEKDGATQNWRKQNPKQPLLLTEGYIALQAESHPVEFRRVEILRRKKS